MDIESARQRGTNGRADGRTDGRSETRREKHRRGDQRNFGPIHEADRDEIPSRMRLREARRKGKCTAHRRSRKFFNSDARKGQKRDRDMLPFLSSLRVPIRFNCPELENRAVSFYSPTDSAHLVASCLVPASKSPSAALFPTPRGAISFALRPVLYFRERYYCYCYSHSKAISCLASLNERKTRHVRWLAGNREIRRRRKKRSAETVHRAQKTSSTLLMRRSCVALRISRHAWGLASRTAGDRNLRCNSTERARFHGHRDCSTCRVS